MARPKTERMQAIERRRGRPLEEDLPELARDHSQREIARLYEVNVSTVSDWMLRFDVPSRKWSAA